MFLPIPEILDLIEKDMASVSVCIDSRCALIKRYEIFQRQAGLDWMIHGKVADVFGFNAILQQLTDDMVNHHGLANPPRTHEDNGTLDSSLLYKWPQKRQIWPGGPLGENLWKFVGWAPPGILPPGSNLHLLRRDSLHSGFPSCIPQAE